MAEQASEGRVFHEAHGNVLKIIIDNAAKRNAFSPEMMEQLSDAFTLLENTAEYRVGVLTAAGDHFTAGLDMPKFFGPNAHHVSARRAMSIRSACRSAALSPW